MIDSQDSVQRRRSSNSRNFSDPTVVINERRSQRSQRNNQLSGSRVTPVNSYRDLPSIGSLHRAIQSQNQRKNKQFYQNLPYVAGYIFIALIILFFLGRAVSTSNNKAMSQEEKFYTQKEQCMIKFSSKKCDVANNSDECKSLLSCIKNKHEQQSSIIWMMQMLGQTIRAITKEVMGLILLIILGILIKLIEVYMKSHREK